MKLIAIGERKKKHVLKEAIKACKQIFAKVLEDEVQLKEILQKKVEENIQILNEAR